MAARLAACDPCRTSKLACDHINPVCSRCRQRGQASRCIYRARPFKRTRALRSVEGSLYTPLVWHQSRTPIHSSSSLDRISTNSRQYPNPGYLGPSSHTTIFNQLSVHHGTDSDERLTTLGEASDELSDIVVDDVTVSNGAILIRQIIQSSEIASSSDLVNTCMASGVNLALAGAFTLQCTLATQSILQSVSQGVQDSTKASKALFNNSCRPLLMNASSSLDDFCSCFCRKSVRWETIGLFFTAVARAIVDTQYFKGLYELTQQRMNFQKQAMHFSDRCLDICLSLDCLNDLQIMLQYENFIAHSFIDGDQSYRSWRRLGDVASSLFALGYHKNTEDNLSAPAFLQELQRAAFARAYSADKNVSIFLGRPPRIHRRYCQFQLPGHGTTSSPWDMQSQFSGDGTFDYTADTKWSAICAILKESILDLPEEKAEAERLQKAYAIQTDAELQWQALPSFLRLEGALKFLDRKAVEQDFMVSARLNYLHVLFLLQLALQERITEPNAHLITISSKMLRLVIEAILLKKQLANSGTGLIWKVAYYGLSAAGIVCLFLLNYSSTQLIEGLSSQKIIQDLNVLVAVIESGDFIQAEDANFALLSRATQTIQHVLERVLYLGKLPSGQNQVEPKVAGRSPVARPEEDWTPWANPGFSDFEIDFWLNLEEHPLLAQAEDELQSLQ